MVIDTTAQKTNEIGRPTPWDAAWCDGYVRGYADGGEGKPALHYPPAPGEPSVASDRPHIITDNEKFGSGFLDENAAGGVWAVANAMTNRINALFSNRQAAEDYIYSKCEEESRIPADYSLQVWAVHEQWPPADEGA